MSIDDTKYLWTGSTSLSHACDGKRSQLSKKRTSYFDLNFLLI